LLSVPRVRDAFNFGPMRGVDWLVALGAGFIGVGWFELYKVRRRGRRTVPVSRASSCDRPSSPS
jgi:Ca2+-transporting ATPase